MSSNSLGTVVGTLFAYKVLKYLTTPFTDFDAYKVGLIDHKGRQLKKPQTKEEKEAWDIGDRVIIRAKRVLERTGALGTAAGLYAAYWLVKECMDMRVLPSTETLMEDFNKLMASEFVPLEEMVLINGLLTEDVGVAAIGEPSEPVVTQKSVRKYKEFNVSDETYAKFTKGKRKFSRWSNYLNLEDETDAELYNYARKNHNAIIVLKNGDRAKAIRFNRRGGGNWARRQLSEHNEIECVTLNIKL